MFDMILIVEKYGLSVGTLILMMFLLWAITRWINRLDTRIREHSIILERIDEELDNFHSGCHVPQGALTKLEEKVIDLEKTDIKVDGDMKKLSGDFIGLKADTMEIKSDVKEIRDLILGSYLPSRRKDERLV